MKKILFLTGTRADYGKLKTLINKVEINENFECFIFVTGMHMLSKYGMTVKEVLSADYRNVYQYINQQPNDGMDNVLAKTIQGLSDYVHEVKPDLIVVHGDRVEALAGAVVGSLNNILVAHIEGGEVSGTIDELIRHAITKMAHLHFVSNEDAKRRLLQLGEAENSVYVIGSPDIDVMTSGNLPSLAEVKKHYNINFEQYAVLSYHPVTTELEKLEENIKNVVESAIQSKKNYVVIYPNNDHGSEIIVKALSILKKHPNFRVFPSIRFEYFLTLLKNSDFILGNSSAGIREMPFYGKPTVNIGTRQKNRSNAKSIINTDETTEAILIAIKQCGEVKFECSEEFGNGNSSGLFYSTICQGGIWDTGKQKQFVDIQ